MDLLKRLMGEKAGQVGEAETGVQPRHLSGEEFDALVVQSGALTVVDFWAEWCGPCHMIAPSVQQLAKEYDGRATIAKLNADDYPEILGRYGIMGIPTLIYFKGGEEVDRVVGVTGYSTLKSKLDRLLA